MALRPLTMSLTVFIRPESRDDFLQALQELLACAQREPGCLLLHAAESRDEAGTFVLLMRWRDEDEYLFQILQRDYFQRYIRRTEPMYAAPAVLAGLESIDPRCSEA
jgi:quinol monooxygenase YgiN